MNFLIPNIIIVDKINPKIAFLEFVKNKKCMLIREMIIREIFLKLKNLYLFINGTKNGRDTDNQNPV